MPSRIEYEIVIDGHVVMSTRLAESETALATTALLHMPIAQCRVLIGSLGLGETVAQALAFSKVAYVTVIEDSPAIWDWHNSGLIATLQPYQTDARLHLQRSEFDEYLRQSVADERTFDVVLLQGNALSSIAGSPGRRAEPSIRAPRLIRSIVAPEGLFATWTDSNVEPMTRELSGSFSRVGSEELEYYDPYDRRWQLSTVIVARP